MIIYNPASLVYNITKKYYEKIILPKISKFKEYKKIINENKFLVMELQKLRVDCYDKNFDSNGKVELIADFNFLFIKANLRTKISDNDIINWNYGKDENNSIDVEFKVDENFCENLNQYFGYVHRLFCPHNGRLEINDEKFITNFLIENKFIGE